LGLIQVASRPQLRPAYSGGGGGGSTLTDNTSIQLTSSVSGTLPSFEFLGGATGAINTGTLNTHFTKSGWTQLFATLSDWYYSNTRTLSRAQSLVYDPAARGESSSNARGSYQFDVGASGSTDVYRSRNYYWQCNASFSGVQFKTDRWQTITDHTGGGGPEVVDGYPPSCYDTSSAARDNMPFSNFTADPGYVGGSTNSPYSQAVLNTVDGYPQNIWVRDQMYTKENSTPGTANGIYNRKIRDITNAGASYNFTVNSTNRIYRGTNDNANPFRYLIFQLYFGNGPTTPNGNDWGDTIFYIDDMYISYSSNGTARRRVELINASTPGSANKFVVQPSTKSGITVTTTVNLGYIGTGQSGLYIVEYDETDTVITTWGPYTS